MPFMLVGKFLFGLLGKKASDGATKALGIGALVALLVLGLGIAKCSYDRSIISAHDAKQVAATAKADRKADAKAADERRTDDTRLSAETQALNQVETAHATDDPRTRRIARQRCLRDQQAARASGGEPPTCR